MHGRGGRAQDAEEVNRALHDVLAEVWVRFDDGHLPDL